MQGVDEFEQRRSLVPHFVNQGRSDAAADHALPGHFDYGDGIVPTSRQPGASPANRGADTAIEIADHGRQRDTAGGDAKRIFGDDIETGEPYACFTFAALGDDVIEEIELCQHSVEAEPQDGE